VIRSPSLALAFAFVAAGASISLAQGGILVQGIADAEGWATKAGSNLLTRNSGRPGYVSRLDLWAAVEPWRRLVVFGATRIEHGTAMVDSTDDLGAELEQAGIRWSQSEAFVVDVGKFPYPVGIFAPRRFSSRNPLIGAPDAYPVQYPVGAQLSGILWRVDYRIGTVSLPVYHEGYTPPPTASHRPVAAIGVTPFVGLRIGASGTFGPYLNDDHTSAQLAGQEWRDYDQRIGGLDIAFSRGHFEARAEVLRSSYDVPGRTDPSNGTAYYVESKYVLTPRIFVAARGGRNDYPFIRAFGNAWVARSTDFHDVEVGAGYRFTEQTLVKASYRTDRWKVNDQNRTRVGPGAHAVAVQLSQSFDVMSWFEGRR
jgi:hypothetical protein